MVKKYKVARVVLVLLASFVIVSMIRFTSANKIIDRMNDNNETVIEQCTKDHLVQSIESTIDSYIADNDMMTNDMKNDILLNLTKDEILKELEGEYSTKFYDYVLKHLYDENEIIDKDKPKATTYLINNEGILALFSNDRQGMNYQENGKIITWEDYYEMAGIPDDRERLVNRFISNDKDYIIMERYGENDKLYTIKEIVDIYNEEGLMALKNYNLVVCSKITDTGDILGVPDSNFMKKNKNRKLYVISSISLYDIVNREAAEVEKHREKWDNLSSTNMIGTHLSDDMLINTIYGMMVFGLVAVLYSDKFEK